jgi:hypothetical protein
MANEISGTMTLTFAKGNIASSSPYSLASGSFNVTVSGTAAVRNVQTVGTSKEVLYVGDVGTPGFCIMHNLDGTNYVEVFPDGTGAAVVKLKAGEWAAFRLAAAAPQVQANTASCSLDYLVISD